MAFIVHSCCERTLFGSPITLSVRGKERLFIVANSGVGATTLLRTLAHLSHPKNPSDKAVSGMC